MKININFPKLDKLVNKMGAEKINWVSGTKSKKIDLSKLFTIEGLDVKFNELQIKEHGFMYKDGQQVVLYIRDQWESYDEIKRDPYKNGRKFHVIGNCKTIDQMRNSGRYDRYVVTANQSGKFKIIARESKYSNKLKKLETPLSVCLNCLIKLNYQGSGYSSRGINNEAKLARKNFNLKIFFKDFVQALINRPKYDELSYPDPVYTADYKITQKKLKEARNYCCSRCKVNLSQMNHRHMLHCHHKDGNPGNNSEFNLEILCICCHAEEGFHLIKPKHMRAQYDKCQNIKKEQGIKI
tara:strand:- start:663 stop:1550 length:888 start_codon:yes stop_codon:yes gene_type:complete